MSLVWVDWMDYVKLEVERSSQSEDFMEQGSEKSFRNNCANVYPCTVCDPLTAAKQKYSTQRDLLHREKKDSYK